MDADTLRIILAVVGALFVAGLYWWERRRNRPDSEDEDFYDDLDSDDEKRDPQFGSWTVDDDGESDPAARVPDQVDSATGEPKPPRDPEPEPVQLELPREPEQPEFDLRPPPTPPDEAEEFPPGPLILTLHVAARHVPFGGAALLHAAQRNGLEPGEFDIFHCILGEGEYRQTLFSMANMVKPGTFPFDAMDGFQSPGVTLFAQLDGTPDDPGRMEEMLGTARGLAEDLDGEVRDEHRRPFTMELEQRLRDRVMAFVGVRLSGAEHG